MCDFTHTWIEINESLRFKSYKQHQLKIYEKYSKSSNNAQLQEQDESVRKKKASVNRWWR